MDATTIGSILAAIGIPATAVVAYLGKRAENATQRFNSVTDQVQEERDRLTTQLAQRDARIAELLENRLADQVELARLRVKIIQLGGQP